MRPAAGLVAVLLACALIGAGAVAGLLPLVAFAATAGVVLVLSLHDAMRARRQPLPTVERDLPAVAPVGIERVVTLKLRHSGSARLTLDAHDLHPGDWPVSGLPRRVQLPPGREVLLPYRITPIARGAFRFDACELRLRSPLGLWQRTLRAPSPQTLRVFPNFAPLAKLALVGADQASRVVGAHLKRRRGEGTDFQQLREYRTGDSLRQIDWKASQRARKLISREYQDERNQQVMLLIDTGRRMLARDGALAHFDHVLNAALMVAYIALRQGDAVGLMTTGGSTRFVPPRRGLGAINPLLDAVFDLHAQPVATDYLDAATQLGTRQPRRALVLLVSNVRDEDIEDLVAAVRQLQRRHLVCVASLREQVLDQRMAQPVRSFDEAVRVAALARYIEYRTHAHDALRAQQVAVLDVTCTELPGALVQHYLAVKRAAQL